MKYQIVTAVGQWYWVDATKDSNRFRVVCWRMDVDTGEVIGLITLEEPHAKTDGNVTRLVTPPPIDGRYLCYDKCIEINGDNQ